MPVLENPHSPLNIQVAEILRCRESRMDVNEILVSPTKKEFAKEYPILFRMLTNYEKEIEIEQLYKMLNMMDNINRNKISAEKGTEIIVGDLHERFTGHIGEDFRVKK